MHVPVLEESVLQYLQPKQGDSYLDVTAGYGGHARAVLNKTGNYEQSVLVDRDHVAVLHLRKSFSDTGIGIMETDFLSAAQQLEKESRQFDTILADLGTSSMHLDNADRGFSFKDDGPLDMRMDQSQTLTAETVVNNYSQKELIDILQRYGEEFRARRIVDAIIKHRPINSTSELADVVASAVRGKEKIHPATKTFQAIRIAVNDELNQVKQVLPVLRSLLKPGGRLCVISFHSLEDRIVKQYFADQTENLVDDADNLSDLVLLTKKPVIAAREEVVSNPRARSAKLRAVAKIKTKGATYANTGKKSLQDVQSPSEGYQ